MEPEDDFDANGESAGASTSEGQVDGSDPFRPHTAPDEPVRATLTCPAGYVCPDGPADSVSGPVELGVTDRRVIVVPAHEHGSHASQSPDDADPLILPFTELGAVSVTAGADPDLELVSADKVTYRLPLSSADRHHAAVAELRWVGEVRGRVLATSQEVTAAADRIDAAAERGAIETALETYGRARAVLDRLFDTLNTTGPIGTAALAPGLTTVERSLEAAVTRAYAARSRDHLDDASAAIEDHDFEAAGAALEDARADRDAAERHAAELLTPSMLRFGLERDLEETLRELGWEIEAVAADPVRRAQEAVVEAEANDDPAVAAERYEAALTDYRGLLPLGWRDRARQFDSDPTAVREDLAQVGERLLDCYRRLAAREREAMAATASDDPEAARDACEAAVAHLERAEEVAAEFAPDAIEAVEDDLAALRSAAETVAAGGEPDADDALESGAAGEARPAADEPGEVVEASEGSAAHERANEGETADGSAAAESAETGETGEEQDSDEEATFDDIVWGSEPEGEQAAEDGSSSGS